MLLKINKIFTKIFLIIVLCNKYITHSVAHNNTVAPVSNKPVVPQISQGQQQQKIIIPPKKQPTPYDYYQKKLINAKINSDMTLKTIFHIIYVLLFSYYVNNNTINVSFIKGTLFMVFLKSHFIVQLSFFFLIIILFPLILIFSKYRNFQKINKQYFIGWKKFFLYIFLDVIFIILIILYLIDNKNEILDENCIIFAKKRGENIKSIESFLKLYIILLFIYYIIIHSFCLSYLNFKNISVKDVHQLKISINDKNVFIIK